LAVFDSSDEERKKERDIERQKEKNGRRKC
jgi:hypothetical protein